MSAVDERLARYRDACQFSMPVDRTAIKVALWRWSASLTGSARRVLFVNSADSLASAADEAYARRAQTTSWWKLDVVFGPWRKCRIRYAQSASGAYPARSIFERSPAGLARLAFDQWLHPTRQANYDSAQLVGAWLAGTGRTPWELSDQSVALSNDFLPAWIVWDVARLAMTTLGIYHANGEPEAWSYLLDALEAGAWLFILVGDRVVVATRPVLSCDDEGRLHSEVSPAFQWNDIEQWYWHGVNLAGVGRHPEDINLRDIYSAINAEVRRVLIERYGEVRFIADCGAVCVDAHPRFGVLWYKDLPNSPPLVLLQVANATPEPTGEYKHFWLRVPPTVRTAREAVAWTFGVDTRGYQPIAES